MSQEDKEQEEGVQEKVVDELTDELKEQRGKRSLLATCWLIVCCLTAKTNELMEELQICKTELTELQICKTQLT